MLGPTSWKWTHSHPGESASGDEFQKHRHVVVKGTLLGKCLRTAEPIIGGPLGVTGISGMVSPFQVPSISFWTYGALGSCLQKMARKRDDRLAGVRGRAQARPLVHGPPRDYWVCLLTNTLTGRHKYAQF